MKATVALSGLRAENPLAFLAALGAVSLLEEAPGDRPRLSWLPSGGTWLPMLHSDSLDTPDAVLDALLAAHRQRDLAEELGWEKDIMKLTREELRDLLRSRRLDSEAARLLAACVAELPLRRDEKTVHYTPFRLMPRVGRARFLETALRESRDGADHLRSCLFDEWRYVADTQSMRWDPASPIPARALMAEAPTHAKPHGVPGAVLFAVRGLASFPLVTQSRRAIPPGMTVRSRFVWPIWRDPLELPVIRMLLTMRWLYELDEEAEQAGDRAGTSAATQGAANRGSLPTRRRRRPADIEAQLRAHGVIATFTAPRVRRGNDDEALGWGVPRIIGDTPAERP